ncbi:ADP-ribosylglycohydrolase family protein [Paenibacillus koleovorans]|uniref:ADP-ribosylglycohydrolase family protein n=1 Tax=Paenibacillus koleovorans TaxID=121608 RepID=UPI000FDAB051|nr:ADP-ribosylglycohydrolase family protein [Paenibacillus koleovorans]
MSTGKTSILNEKDYYRTVYGGWLGKNIGGTLGEPVEGQMKLLNLSFYPKLGEGPLPNDDLDLQLVNLHALEQYGPLLNAQKLGQEWLDHVFFPFDEYGYALTNMRRGLIPPVSGWFGNPFTNCMGSPIRSEIWAMVAPGAPEVAAYYAYQDAIVDHAGGEGVYGEVFFATIESAIFVEKDRDRLIQIGLRSIPEQCRTAKAVNDLLRWHREGHEWIEARKLILQHHGHPNFTDAPQNIAFTILGWLYGEDFEDAILKAVNCGYDTDCTAATLGAILGMLHGAEALPAKWVEPVGDRIAVSAAVNGFPAPLHLEELTRRTIRMGKQVLAAWDTSIIVHDQQSTAWNRSDLMELVQPCSIEVAATENKYLLPPQSTADPMLGLAIDYGYEGPAIGYEASKELAITLTNRSNVALSGSISLELPANWTGPRPEEVEIELKPGQSQVWKPTIRNTGALEPYYRFAAVWRRHHDGSFWSEHSTPFTLVLASKWTIWVPENSEANPLFCPTNRIAWDKLSTVPGVYRASTRLLNPTERTIKLIAASNSPITVRLNGDILIQCEETIDFMPAYHRAPQSQFAQVVIPAGEHILEIEAVKGDTSSLEVYVLPVSTKETKAPGPNYYITDILFC